MDHLDSSGYQTPEEVENEEMRAAVNAAIKAVREQLKTNKGVKAAVADLIKLLQLRKELEEDRPRHVSVRWIEECKISNEE